MKSISCAVCGATGVVGQQFLNLLDRHPYFRVESICASESRTGQTLSQIQPHITSSLPSALQELTFDPLDADVLVKKGIQVVFSALPADIAREFEPRAAKAGLFVFSNAGAHRMNDDVPILIPEANASHLALVQQQKSEGFIVTNANCTTTGLVMSLLPFLGFGIRRLIVSSYQAMSGAGYPGLSALDMSSNVIPYIANEEKKMKLETTKILGALNGEQIAPPECAVDSHCVRVPTVTGHLLSVHAEIDHTLSENDLLHQIDTYRAPEAVRGLPTAPERPVILTRDPMRPQPRLDVMAGDPERARGMAVTIGRPVVQNRREIRYLSLSHNLIRGAAGGSVLNAELAYRENLI
jgi:aspartate-semialdehyde dehydrogenase